MWNWWAVKRGELVALPSVGWLFDGEFFEEDFDGLGEGETGYGDDDIDGVKIGLTVKASCQVIVETGGRMESGAYWTLESEQVLCFFHLQMKELCDDLVDRDLISDFPDQGWGIIVWHNGSPMADGTRTWFV